MNGLEKLLTDVPLIRVLRSPVLEQAEQLADELSAA